MANAQAADKHVDRFCQLSRQLSDKYKSRPARGADAAAFMAPLMDYERPLDATPGQLHLPKALAERLRDAGANWFTAVTDEDLAGLDFSWLAKLEKFDHWSLWSAGPLPAAPFDHFASAPIPVYLPLMQWAKLRFAQARRRGDMAQASAEVRHLADLTRSQGILISVMVAQLLYRIDAQARAGTNAAGFNVAGWEPAEPAELDALRRTNLASRSFAMPGVKPATLLKAIGCAPNPCMALLEAATVNQQLSRMGSTHASLIRELAEQNNCELAVFDRIAGETPDDPKAAPAKENDLDRNDIEMYLGDAPWIR